MKKIVVALALAGLGFSLSACSTSTHEGTVSDPIPVDELYTTTNYKLDDGFVVSCISKGGGKSAVLSCVEALPSAKDIVLIKDSNYTVRYRELEDGRVVPCLSKGGGNTAVISCVVQAR